MIDINHPLKNICLLAEILTNSIDKVQKTLINFNSIQYLIKTINGGGTDEFDKSFWKIKSKSDANFPLGRMLKVRILKVIVRSVFEEDDQYYAQVFIDGCFYEL